MQSDSNNEEKSTNPDLEGLLKAIRPLFIVGILCVLVFVVFFIYGLVKKDSHLEQIMSFSWLFGFIVCFTIGLGGFFWVALHHATNASWGVAVRRIKEKLAGLFPYLLVISLPLMLFPQARNILWHWLPLESKAKGQSSEFVEKINKKLEHTKTGNDKILYVKNTTESELPHNWTAKDKGIFQALKRKIDAKRYAGKTDEEIAKYILSPDALYKKAFSYYGGMLHKKRYYLNSKFFYLRYVAYFVLLIFMARFFIKNSLKTDETPDEDLQKKNRKYSYPFLLLFAVCITFASVDWLMGLNYLWFSTMWGVYIFAGSALSSMAILIITLSLLRKFGFLQNVVTSEHYHIMGKLMHSFVIFWAYIAFSQYFLIWYSNITEETQWFLVRNTGGWHVLSLTLLFCHFIIPFVGLLPAWSKIRYKWLTFWSIWILVFHIVDIYWIIIPERAPKIVGEPFIPWAWLLDILALAGIFCLFMYFYLVSLLKTKLYPQNDLRLQDSLKLTN